jgi:hypothetical protein
VHTLAHTALLALEGLTSSRTLSLPCPAQASRGIVHSLQVFRVGGARGWGLRAGSAIPAGGFVCTYTGELLTEEQVQSPFTSLDLCFRACLGPCLLLLMIIIMQPGCGQHPSHSASPCYDVWLLQCTVRAPCADHGCILVCHTVTVRPHAAGGAALRGRAGQQVLHGPGLFQVRA